MKNVLFLALNFYKSLFIGQNYEKTCIIKT